MLAKQNKNKTALERAKFICFILAASLFSYIIAESLKNASIRWRIKWMLQRAVKASAHLRKGKAISKEKNLRKGQICCRRSSA
jgi:hypothetical protein